MKSINLKQGLIFLIICGLGVGTGFSVWNSVESKNIERVSVENESDIKANLIEANYKQVDLEKRKAFEPAKKLLLKRKVPFNPEILLSPTWRQQLSSNFSEMAEMQTSVILGNTLQGLEIADTIILPERVELTGDLVILANNLVFEGKQTVIKGVGKNVYIFPVKESFHLGKSFQETLQSKGIPTKSIPVINQRSNETFEFDEKFSGILTIRVNGQGYPEWLEKSKKTQTKSVLIKNTLDEAPCPSQTPTCNGNEGGQGEEGTPGIPAGNPVPPPVNGLDGSCILNSPNGLSGFPGDDGETGPDNAGMGGRGLVGGGGGTIMFNIAPPFQMGYVFDSIGGMGGKGGTGGYGATGSDGQEGGKGGNGQDCECRNGGAGSGADGKDGGRGGKGGRGGVGGPGGPGGPGGRIFVTAPFGFNSGRISTRVNGGYPGLGGNGGLGGYPGFSGEGGKKGTALGNYNCPSTGGMDGRRGRKLSTLGSGDRGENGTAGTITGETGEYHLEILPPPGYGDECNLGFSASDFTDFLSGNSDLNPDPYCCSNVEAGQCMLNGGTWIPSSCTCISPIVIDVAGNGFNLTDAQNGVLFDITNSGSPMQVAWTSANSDDAWLALDRDNNGKIDNGKELFDS